jgi:hypothetical protein
MQNRFVCAASFGLGVCLALGALVLLVGCSSAPRLSTWLKQPAQAPAAPAAAPTEDAYVYFPRYEVYYNRTQGYFAFWDGRAWRKRFEPPADTTVAALLASPFVAMPFHDDPRHHHADVARSYPASWGQQGPLLTAN